MRLASLFTLSLLFAVLGRSQSLDLLSPTQLNRGTTALFTVLDSSELGKPVGCTMVDTKGATTFQPVLENTSYCYFGALRSEGTYWVTVTYNDTAGDVNTGDPVSVLVTEKASFELTGDIPTGGSFFQGYGGAISVRAQAQNWNGGKCPKNTEATITLRFNDSELTTLDTDCRSSNGYVYFTAGLFEFLPTPAECLEASCELSAWVRLGSGKATPAGRLNLVPGMYSKDSRVEVALFREDSRNLCLHTTAVTRSGYPTAIKRSGIWSPNCTSVTIVGPQDFCCAFQPLDPLNPYVEFVFYIATVEWVSLSATRAEKQSTSSVNLLRIVLPTVLVFAVFLIGAAVFVFRYLRRRVAAFKAKQGVARAAANHKSRRAERRRKMVLAAMARKQPKGQADAFQESPAERVSSSASDTGSISDDSQPSVHWGQESGVEFTTLGDLEPSEPQPIDPPRPGAATPPVVAATTPIVEVESAAAPVPLDVDEIVDNGGSDGLAATTNSGSDFFEKNDSPRRFKSAPRYAVGGAAAALSWEQVEPQGAIEFHFNPAPTGEGAFPLDDPTPLPTPKVGDAGGEDSQPAFEPEEVRSRPEQVRVSARASAKRAPKKK